MSELAERLEPRVVKVEAGLDAITRNIVALTGDVRDLAIVVRQQGQQTENQIKELLVGVSTASGPRKTDWHLVLGGVGLILAIGAAAFSPIMLRMGDITDRVYEMNVEMRKHHELQLHPVGKTRIDGLEFQLKERLGELDAKLQKEYALVNQTIRLQVDGLSDRFEEVRLQGSPMLRERLALLESRVSDLMK